MNKIKALICIIVPISLAFLLNTKFGDVPPLLKFMDPFMGFWQNAENFMVAKNKKIILKNKRTTHI